MSVSISEILAGASAHTVPLAGECAGYLVLAAADQAVTAPRRIGPREVHLEGDGSVRVEGSRAAAESDSEGDLRALLDALLLNASSATPALLRASRRAPGRGIAALVREIETALIPVNRAAAHRALARLERETERARLRGRLGELPESLPARREVPPTPAPAPVAAVVSAPPTPAPPPVASAPPPAVDLAVEIPSLFAPPVEPILAEVAEHPAEIETRPEPIVARRSSKPPPLPRTPSPPPLPVVEAQRSTPFFGTVVSDTLEVVDDEMDIEVVVDDDELIDDELTSVLVRSAPLEISAMVDVAAAPETFAAADTHEAPEPTDPCPPAIDEQAADTDRTAAPVIAEDGEPELEEREGTLLLADVMAPPPVQASDSREASDAEAAAALAAATELPEIPEAPEPSAPELEHTIVLETHGNTAALALAIEPVVAEPAPVSHVPLPKPRPSDVEELLGRLAPADEGTDDVRTSLKSLAGLEPTPQPPET